MNKNLNFDYLNESEFQSHPKNRQRNQRCYRLENYLFYFTPPYSASKKTSMLDLLSHLN